MWVIVELTLNTLTTQDAQNTLRMKWNCWEIDFGRIMHTYVELRKWGFFSTELSSDYFHQVQYTDAVVNCGVLILSGKFINGMDDVKIWNLLNTKLL